MTDETERPEDTVRRFAQEIQALRDTVNNQTEVIRELKARSLSTLQQRMHDWRKAAYPDTRGIELQALGVAEESGELAHAVLKYKQGIRGYDFAKTHDEVADAIGDIIIYAMGVADTLDISVEEALCKTVEHVINRNITQGSDAGDDELFDITDNPKYFGKIKPAEDLVTHTITEPKGVDYAGHVPGRPPRRGTDALRGLSEEEQAIARSAVAKATKPGGESPKNALEMIREVTGGNAVPAGEDRHA